MEYHGTYQSVMAQGDECLHVGAYVLLTHMHHVGHLGYKGIGVGITKEGTGNGEQGTGVRMRGLDLVMTMS